MAPQPHKTCPLQNAFRKSFHAQEDSPAQHICSSIDRIAFIAIAFKSIPCSVVEPGCQGCALALCQASRPSPPPRLPGPRASLVVDPLGPRLVPRQRALRHSARTQPFHHVYVLQASPSPPHSFARPVAGTRVARRYLPRPPLSRGRRAPDGPPGAHDLWPLGLLCAQAISRALATS